MKIGYRIQTGAEGFRPFTVTFKIETEAQANWFHDQVAIRVAQSGDFIGDVFEASRGNYTRTAEGEFETAAGAQPPCTVGDLLAVLKKINDGFWLDPKSGQPGEADGMRAELRAMIAKVEARS